MACANLNKLKLLVLAAGLVAGSPVVAETYKWVDEKGQVHYTDRIPTDAVNRGMSELNKQGITKKLTTPALTPEQRKAADERLEEQRQNEKLQAEVRNRENALMSSYTSEADIDVAKRRNLALIGSGILNAEARIKSLQTKTAALAKEKLFYENKPIPEKIAQEQAAIAAEIHKQNAAIDQLNAEALALISRYDAQKLRFREILARDAVEGGAVKKQ